MGNVRLGKEVDITLFKEQLAVLNFATLQIWVDLGFIGLADLLKNTPNAKENVQIESIDVSEKRLGSFQLENIDEITLLSQTGYLTIKDRDDDIYTLGYLNKEVRDSMNNLLLAGYTHQQDTKPAVRDIFRCLGKRDFKQLFEILNSMFGEIPYQIFDAKQEKYYHAIIFLTFRLLGYYTQAKVSVNAGRIDVVVEAKDAVFIFEFKVNGTIQQALDQIHENRYYQRYEAVVCQDKQIKEYKVEQFFMQKLSTVS